MDYPQLKSKLGQTEAKQNVRVHLKTSAFHVLLFHHNKNILMISKCSFYHFSKKLHTYTYISLIHNTFPFYDLLKTFQEEITKNTGLKYF